MRDRGRPPVLVFDLDGTILRINSFPRWVLFLIGGRISGLRPARRACLSFSALGLLCRRKFGGMSHDAALRHLQRIWRTEVSAPARRRAGMHSGGEGPSEHGFPAALQRHVRANMRPLLAAVAAEALDAVLATAAAADYAVELGRGLGFRHVLATPSDRAADEPLNAGMRKRDRVIDFLAAESWLGRPLILLTDHIDDLPLIWESDLVCWFGPEKRMARARAAAPYARFVFCRDLTDEAVAALARDFVPPVLCRSPAHAASRRANTVS